MFGFVFFHSPPKAARNVRISLLTRLLIQTPELQSWKPLSHCDPIFTGLGGAPSHSFLVLCSGCSAATPPFSSPSYIHLTIERRAPQLNNKQLLKHLSRLVRACCRCPSISLGSTAEMRRKKYSKVLKVFYFIILLTLFGTMQSAAAPIEEDVQSPRFSLGPLKPGQCSNLAVRAR